MPNLKKKCNTCKHNYKANGDEPRCNRMCENFDEYKPMTNYEKIKAMSIGEMANLLFEVQSNCTNSNSCQKCRAKWCLSKNEECMQEWLESEVEDDG